MSASVVPWFVSPVITRHVLAVRRNVVGKATVIVPPRGTLLVTLTVTVMYCVLLAGTYCVFAEQD
jgi:hypothetical protein